jgi:hypothetical protein
MDKRRQRSNQVDAALVPLVQRERCSSSTSCAGLQSRELPPHARDSRSDCGLVADKSAREADQDWCKGRQPRSLRHVSDGGGRDPTTVVRCDHAENCRFAIAPNGNGNMSTPATVRGKNDGELRPYEYAASLFFAQWPIRPPITRHCYSSGHRRPPETTGTVDFGSNTLAIWGIPVKLGRPGSHNNRKRRWRAFFVHAACAGDVYNTRRQGRVRSAGAQRRDCRSRGAGITGCHALPVVVLTVADDWSNLKVLGETPEVAMTTSPGTGNHASLAPVESPQNRGARTYETAGQRCLFAKSGSAEHIEPRFNVVDMRPMARGVS